MTARRSTRIAFAALALTATFVLAGCGSSDDAPEGAPDTAQEPAGPAAGTENLESFLAAFDLDGLDARQVIERLDTTGLDERNADLIASIRPNEIAFANADGVEASMPMPRDEFYLSIAPYMDQTHECYFHSLTTCVGELQNAEIDVTITNADTGELILEESDVTYDNGFIGFWVPSGINAEVTIEHDGLSATEVLPTISVDDRTCVTTMQLG